MARKNQHHSFDVQSGLRTDYILIATGVGAVVIGFAYLLLS